MPEIASELIAAFKRGNKVLICGNGGSASQAQHFAAELMGRFEHDRPALPALSLTTDTSVITAIGNDLGFDYIFSRQVEGLGVKGDILIILSTSGGSLNCIEAEIAAKEKKMLVINFPTKKEMGYATTAQVQEYHLKLIHQICREVEGAFLEN